VAGLRISLAQPDGFRAIASDLRGFGRSDLPERVPAYSLQNVIADVIGILDRLGIAAADILGHDWGAAVA
jgi:pimeloyl-ACP methyl ester carboxylesterase